MSISKVATTMGVSLAVITGSMLAVNAASAHFGSDEAQSERVTALAEKLGVEESAVQGAFDELKQEHQAEREAQREEHLASLVTEGTLTQAQADELSTMNETFREEIEALRDYEADRDTIKVAMQENKAEVEAWAERQGINLDDVRPERSGAEGRRGNRGHHGSVVNMEDSSEES